MKNIILISLIISLMSAAAEARSSWFKDLFKQANLGQQKIISDTEVRAGLKETLKVGIENTIKQVGAENGYFNNELIKIPMPANLKKVDTTLRKIGMAKTMDELVIKMNRAAESAAPLAADIFAAAITEMTFDDARAILRGNQTAATDYFRKAAWDKLYTAFKPMVEKTMSENQVAQNLNTVMAIYNKIPLKKMTGTVNLTDYVLTEGLDGLFTVLAQQEQKIRTEPAAQITDLLKRIWKK